MKIFFLWMLCLLSFAAHGDFSSAINQFENYRATVLSEISHPRHSPVLLHHGSKTPQVVIYFHGLYESPQYSKGILANFHSQGMNVLAPLLAGHWRKDYQAKDLKYQNWMSDLEQAIRLGRELGDEIILAGFSTGGLLAIRGALDFPNDVKKLILWAPAIYLTQETYWAIQYGEVMNLTLNDRLSLPYDGYDVTYYAPHIGQEVVNLIENTLDQHASGFTQKQKRKSLAGKIKIPLMLISAEADDTVSFSAQKDFFESLNVKKDHLVFAKSSDILHGNLTKRSDDVFIGWEDRFNFQFDLMVETVNRFLNQ